MRPGSDGAGAAGADESEMRLCGASEVPMGGNGGTTASGDGPAAESTGSGANDDTLGSRYVAGMSASTISPSTGRDGSVGDVSVDAAKAPAGLPTCRTNGFSTVSGAGGFVAGFAIADPAATGAAKTLVAQPSHAAAPAASQHRATNQLRCISRVSETAQSRSERGNARAHRHHRRARNDPQNQIRPNRGPPTSKIVATGRIAGRSAGTAGTGLPGAAAQPSRPA